MIKTIHKCRICGNPFLEEIVDFGKHWIQGYFNYPNQSPPPQRKISTKVVRCVSDKFENGCGLVQNLVSIDPKILYSNYGYSSSISKTMQLHLRDIVKQITEINPNIKSVLDVGGNTGELIKNHEDAKIKIVIDPSNIAKEALTGDNGITLINRCYPDALLSDKKFDAIYSIACLYDIDNLHKFLESIKNNLNPNGVYTFEVAYLPSVIKNCSYDGMVFEHINLFSLSVLDRVFKENGLKIFLAKETDTNGGSLLCVSSHIECKLYDGYQKSVDDILLQEFDMELDTEKPYINFRLAIEENGKAIINELKKLKESGESIYIYGASTKLNLILQTWNIGTNFIVAAAERDSRKVGGSLLNGIPIVSEEEARRKATVFLVGPYHFKKEILDREKESIANGIKFLFPLPKVELI